MGLWPRAAHGTGRTATLTLAATTSLNWIVTGERITLSERDSLMELDLLENPPLPNAKLRCAAAAFTKRPHW